MKIYKPTFEDLLEEAKEPIYIQEHTRTTQLNCQFMLSVTAFNPDDHPLEYVITVANFWPGDSDSSKKAYASIDEITAHMRRTMDARGIKYYPGIINAEQMTGNPYGVDRRPGAVSSRPDLSTFTKTIEGEEMSQPPSDDLGKDADPDGDFDQRDESSPPRGDKRGEGES